MSFKVIACYSLTNYSLTMPKHTPGPHFSPKRGTMNKTRITRLATCVSISLLTILILLGCSSSTNPKDGSISGTIVLVNDSGDPNNDPVDFSGVSIALYNLAVLDTAIVRTNQQYSQIGVIINQETEFEPRNQTPVYTVMTSSDGAFELKGITPGYYNMVISKDGWGHRYLFDCQVNEGNNSLAGYIPGPTQKTNLNLYPEKILASFDPISVLKEDHVYRVISSDVTLNHDLSMENGSTIQINKNLNLIIAGELNTVDTGSGTYRRITVDGDDSGYDSCFGRVMIQGNAEISHLVLSNSMTGMQFQSASVSASNLRLKNGPSGFVFRNNPSVNVSQVAVSNIGDLVTSGDNIYTTDGGIDLTGCASGLIQKVVAVGCNAGIRVRENCAIQVSNCFFANNSVGLEASNNFSTFTHNQFEGNYSYDARTYGTCSPVLTYNNFNSTRGLNIGLSGSLSWQNCTPSISYNNFQCKYGWLSPWRWGFAIRMVLNNMLDVTAANNYFYTTDTEIIDLLILDQNDYDPNDSTNLVNVNTGYLIYVPYRTSRVSNAGIQL